MLESSIPHLRQIPYDSLFRKFRKPQKTANDYNILLGVLYKYPTVNDLFKNQMLDNRNLKIEVWL